MNQATTTEDPEFIHLYFIDKPFSAHLSSEIILTIIFLLGDEQFKIIYVSARLHVTITLILPQH